MATNVVQSGNDCYLRNTTAMTNSVTGAAVTDAVFTAQFYKQSTTTGAWSVAGSAVTLSHTSGGLYQGTQTAAVIDAHYATGAPYWIQFVATSGAYTGTENLRGFVRERGPS